MENKELSFGEKAVGLTFNHAEGEVADHVQSIKVAAANFIDICNNLRNQETMSAEQKRMYSVAITEAQTAQMWAVKGVTWAD